MRAFVTDSFTDTNGTSIASHTGELGASWSALTGSSVVPTIVSNALDPSTGADANALYYASGVPPSADYSVSVTCVAGSALNPIAGPALRMSTSAQTGYFGLLFFLTGSTIFAIYKYVGGSIAQVANSGGTSPVTAGQTYTITLSATGSALTLKVQRSSDGYWASGGTWVESEANCISTTDSSISAAGRAGFWLSKTSAPSVITSISADQSATSATATTLSGPSSGTTGVASSNFTAGANGEITGTVTVTPSDAGNGGTFTPTTVAISSGTPTATFTYTPASTGSKTISISDNGGLTDATPLTYTATAAPTDKYTRIDATDTIYGQNIMVLVPNSNAAIPYNSANPTPVVLYVHGAGEDQTGLVTESVKFSCRDALLDAGYILAGSAAHGSANWGNQASVSDYTALEKYVRDNYNVQAVALWGQSMGGLDALSVVSQGQFTVTGVLLTYPVCNLANLYGLWATSDISTAYGITGSGIYTYANQTYGFDPALRTASAYRDIPMRFYASASDTVVPKAQNTDVLHSVVSASRTEADIVVCSGDHGHASHFVPSEYVAFFQRCFATATRTINITLTTNGTTPVASATALKWAFWETATPGVLLAPVAQGAAETTDGSGVLVISLATRLAPGAVGWLIVTDSDGTTTQSPAHKAFSGPVVVA